MNVYKYRPTPAKIARKARRFLAMRCGEDFAKLISVPLYKIQLKAHYPEYNLLEIPKQDGSLRPVEDPSKKLKEIQRAINSHLQCIYYHCKTDAAYGFMLNAWRDPEPRTIVTNARQHLGCRWLLNLDFEDFFHQFKVPQVQQIFARAPFRFDDDLIELLTRLVTHKGRLPMGAPSSPVLSNFACREVDEAFLMIAYHEGWRFTRFADDLSFSSASEIDDKHLKLISDCATRFHLSFNQNKTKLYTPDELKVVTGLAINGQVTIPEGFIEELHTELDRLRVIFETQALYRLARPEYLHHFIDRVEGKVQFVEYVLGKHDPLLLDLHDRLHHALNPTVQPQMLRWLDFPYHRMLT